MLLTVKTISHLLRRERNHHAVAMKTGLTGATVSLLAKNDTRNCDTKTLQVLSDYFVQEFDYAKTVIFNSKEE